MMNSLRNLGIHAWVLDGFEYGSKNDVGHWHVEKEVLLFIFSHEIALGDPVAVRDIQAISDFKSEGAVKVV